jgi:predicted RND superfamily exporter protein
MGLSTRFKRDREKGPAHESERRFKVCKIVKRSPRVMVVVVVVVGCFKLDGSVVVVVFVVVDEEEEVGAKETVVCSSENY